MIVSNFIGRPNCLHNLWLPVVMAVLVSVAGSRPALAQKLVTGAELPRLAQGEATRTTETSGPDGSPSAAQGALPVDLGTITRIKIGGQTLPGGSLERVGNLDILAPAVAQMPRLGVTVTRASPDNIPGNLNTPSQDHFFQINIPDRAPIVLTVGQAVASIDRKEQPLRAAPLFIGGKIWLPIFSLAPLIGAATRIEADGTLNVNPTVQSVDLFSVKGMVVITVKTSAPLPPNSVLMGTMENPPRLYLDFPGYSMGFDATNTTDERVVAGRLNEVLRVRAGLFQKFPDTTRIALDLVKPMGGVAQPLPDKTLFAFILVAPGRTPDVVQPVMEVPSPPQQGLRGLLIVVDAGHGGHDVGARGARSDEKDHTLDIARRLRDDLMARGASVIMTRSGDYFISLQGRVDFANSRRADIFVSVHINSYRPTSNGTETFYYTAQSQALARSVHNQLVKATGLKSRGISQARFYVIRNTWMPSILTESAFISNPQEEALMLDPNWRAGVARGIGQGISDYVGTYIRPAGSAS